MIILKVGDTVLSFRPFIMNIVAMFQMRSKLITI